MPVVDFFISTSFDFVRKLFFTINWDQMVRIIIFMMLLTIVLNWLKQGTANGTKLLHVDRVACTKQHTAKFEVSGQLNPLCST